MASVTRTASTSMMTMEENDHWIRCGHAMYAEFMHRVEKIDRIGVKGMNQSTDEKRVTLIDKRKVYGTLEEIADLYVSEDKKMVLDFTESKAVAVFHSPSAQHPMEYIGFRWSYYKTPSRLVPSQDFFYLETMKPFVDVYGRRGWAKCSHSIEHPMCPDTSASRGINRGRLYYSGVVFVESREKGVLETTFYYSLDTTSIPSFILPVVMKARGKNNAVLINHYVKLARVTAYAGRSNSTKLQQQLMDEKRCGACSTRMPLWSSRSKCHFCKSYVCKRCCEVVSQRYLFDDDAAVNSCMLCAEMHGSKIASLMDDDESSHSSVTEDTDCRGENGTPSSTRSLDRGRNSKLSRSMSMPGSSRPPVQPKLIDFELSESVMMKPKQPTSSHSKSRRAGTPSSDPGSNTENHAQPRLHVRDHKHKPNQRHHHVDKDRTRHSSARRHIERADTVPPSRARHQRYSEDEPTRIRQAKQTFARENIDLSYLSAFKVK